MKLGGDDAEMTWPAPAAGRLEDGHERMIMGAKSVWAGHEGPNVGGRQPPVDGLPPEEMPWPFDADEYRMSMGLRSLDPAAWTTLDWSCPALMAERQRLLDSKPEAVLRRLPGMEAAETELSALMLDHLLSRHSGLFGISPAGILNRLTGKTVTAAGDPLARLNALAPEDYCLLRRMAEGWVLSAAILCFPNRWKLSEKLGKPLLGIHAPVPGYPAVLANPVDRFLDGLRPGRGVWRTNWALNDDPALFQPEETSHRDPRDDITRDNAAERLVLRVERQTLVKLPDSGSVAFGIRTYQRPIGTLTGPQARQFAAVLRSVPAETARYKGLHRTGALALQVLDAQAGGSVL